MRESSYSYDRRTRFISTNPLGRAARFERQRRSSRIGMSLTTCLGLGAGTAALDWDIIQVWAVEMVMLRLRFRVVQRCLPPSAGR